MAVPGEISFAELERLDLSRFRAARRVNRDNVARFLVIARDNPAEAYFVACANLREITSLRAICGEEEAR